MNYPDKELIVNTLVEAARRAGMNSSSRHPEDIGIAMMNAIEEGANTIDILHQNGHLTNTPKV